MDTTTVVVMSLVFVVHEVVLFSMIASGFRKTHEKIESIRVQEGQDDDEWGLTVQLDELRRRRFSPKMKNDMKGTSR